MQLLFKSPAADTAPEGSFTPILTVVVSAVPSATLDTIVASAKKSLPRTFTGYTMIDDARVQTTSGVPAHILGGTYTEGPLSLRSKQLIVVGGGTTYTVTGFALASVWDTKQYNALFDAALTSLNISAFSSPTP